MKQKVFCKDVEHAIGTTTGGAALEGKVSLDWPLYYSSMKRTQLSTPGCSTHIQISDDLCRSCQHSCCMLSSPQCHRSSSCSCLCPSKGCSTCGSSLQLASLFSFFPFHIKFVVPVTTWIQLTELWRHVRCSHSLVFWNKGTHGWLSLSLAPKSPWVHSWVTGNSLIRVCNKLLLILFCCLSQPQMVNNCQQH